MTIAMATMYPTSEFEVEHTSGKAVGISVDEWVVRCALMVTNGFGIDVVLLFKVVVQLFLSTVSMTVVVPSMTD